MTLVGLRESDIPEAEGSASAWGRITVAELSQRLRERIASHALPPAVRLREWNVAAEFGVPRLLAREALGSASSVKAFAA